MHIVISHEISNESVFLHLTWNDIFLIFLITGLKGERGDIGAFGEVGETGEIGNETLNLF